MKNKKLCTAVAGLALLANLGLVSMASAVDTTTSSQGITAGSLTIVALPATVNFNNVATSLSTTNSDVNFGVNSVDISDLRGTVNAITFSVTATDFNDTTAQTTNSIDNTALQIRTDGDNTLTAVSGSDCTSGITISQSALSGFLDGTDTGANGGLADVSDAKTLLSGDSRARVMQCQMEPALRVVVPARKAADTYRTTLVFSIS